MTSHWKAQLEAALDRYAGGKQHASEQLVLAAQNGELEIELSAADRIGCAVGLLRYRSRALEQATLAEMRQRADQLSKRLSYLLEPIRTIEVDRAASEVQLRSDPPTRTPDASSYYELLIERGAIRLVRYEKPRGAARRPQPAHFTRQVLARLLDDLVAAGQ